MVAKKPHFAITVGRSFGSGGHTIGHALAKHFDVPFYDHELLIEAARHSGLSTDCFERNDERTPRFLSGLYHFNMGVYAMPWQGDSNSISGDTVYKTQCDLIRSLAAEGSCVIVGRTADYVLRDMPNVVNIFIHAPEDVCVQRIMQRSEKPLTREQALSLMRKTNRLRANFYNFYSDKTWGDASSYHLTIDSSALPLDSIVRIIADYVTAKVRNND